MTATTVPPAAHPSAAAPQSAVVTSGSVQIDLALRQLAAVETFTRTLRAAEQAVQATARSREMQLDAARRTDVLRRQHAAVVARAHDHLQGAGEPGQGGAGRVVLAHRNAWFRSRVTGRLHELGLQVVAEVDNGADAIGIGLCEQPDLVLVEDTLAMVPGTEVVAQLRALCPATRIVAHCDYSDRADLLLQAGAHEVHTRRVPPADVAAAMVALLAAA